MNDSKDIVVIGGGLAGLISSILLTRQGFKVALVEKKSYPFHRVCGEYISNEVRHFLNRNDLLPSNTDLAEICNFSLSSTSGRRVDIKLPLGGFGISRFKLDHSLYLKAVASGCEVIESDPVTGLKSFGKTFVTQLKSGKQIESKLVISAHGKRSNIDQLLERDFFRERSPYLGVKYHIKIDLPRDTISLHNFKNGYCGISSVEGDTYNLCYLTHRANLRNHKSIEEMEKNVLYLNPHLKSIIQSADFVFDKPMIINEISFAAKPLVVDNILMCGDSAGMITPLCGNGMAMAIHSAKILSDIIATNRIQNGFQLDRIAKVYEKEWSRNFKRRLQVGRLVQGLFGGRLTSELALTLLQSPFGKGIVRLTHGKPF